MADMNQRIRNIGIVPVIKLDSADQAKPLAQALIAGGLPVAEVTFRTSAGEESIRIMRAEFPTMLVGAGTITTVESAGKQSPLEPSLWISGYSEDVVSFCQAKGIPVYPE